MIKYSFYIFLFLILISPIQAQHKRDKLIDKILKAQEKQDYAGSIKYLNQLISKEPDNASAYILRADSYINLKQHDLAIKDLNTSIKLKPQCTNYFMRGNCYSNMQNSDKAILDYSKALELCADDTATVKSIYINRGTAKIRKRDFMGAHDDYMYVYQLDSNDFSGVYGLSRVYMELGPDSLTVRFLMKADQLRPNHPDITNNIGFYYLNHEEYEAAMIYFKKSITLGNDAFSWNNLGFCKYKLGDHNGALKDINRSIELLPENSYAWKNRALVYLAMNNQPDACADLEKALELGYSVRYGYEVQELYNKYCK